MNVLSTPLGGRVAMVMTTHVIAGTGLGYTITKPNEFYNQASIDPNEFDFWDTLDAPNANPWDRMQRIRRTNAQIRLLSAGVMYFAGGTGAGEPPQYAVAEARSNRIRTAVRDGRQTIRIGVQRVHEKVLASDSQQATSVTDVAAAVGDIRTRLSLSITELSVILDVKRPTIYSWLRGDSQPHARNLERISFLHQISQRWYDLSGRPLRRHLRHAFDDNGTTLFGLLKKDDLDFEEIEKHLLALAELPVSPKLSSMKELAARYGFPAGPNPESEASWELESGKRFASDLEDPH